MEFIDTQNAHLLKMIEDWLGNGSGWTVEAIDEHWANIAKYKPLRGSSYMELPSKLSNARKGLINIRNGKSQEFNII